MGARVEAVEAARIIKRLLTERYTKALIARQLGLKRPILELHTDPVKTAGKIRLRTVLRLRRVCRQAFDGTDEPDDASACR